MSRRRLSEIIYFILPLAGGLFFLWYISNAACDVVYSDYIRLINQYLPDVADPDKFFVADLFTRIPASFLQRLINVRLFGFSVTFDRLCGIAGLMLCALVLAAFSCRKRIGYIWYTCVIIVMFSLNKWEILLNGTAWAHLVSFGLFFVYYYIFDRGFFGNENVVYRCSLPLLPFVILMFAGEYIAAYSVAMLLVLSYAVYIRLKEDSGYMGMFTWRYYLLCLVTVLAAFLIYFVSRRFAVWEHAGAAEIGLVELMSENPLFIPRFFIKTFAGAVLGQETIQMLTETGVLSDWMIIAIGLAVILAYLVAIVLYLAKGMYRRSLFPAILLISGGLNHVMVTISRWIFLKESYALSSRYSGQFMIGLIGVLLIFGMYAVRDDRGYTRRRQKKAGLVLPAVFAAFIVMGNLYTSYQEIKKAPYREANYEKMSEMMVNYRNIPEEELLKNLEWHKAPEIMYNAIRILEENKLNVFR